MRHSQLQNHPATSHQTTRRMNPKRRLHPLKPLVPDGFKSRQQDPTTHASNRHPLDIRRRIAIPGGTNSNAETEVEIYMDAIFESANLRTRSVKVQASRNISPSPHRPDQARLDSAFLADRGVKLPPSATLPTQLPEQKCA